MISRGKPYSLLEKKGNGPGELLPPVQIFTDQDTLYLYHRQKRILYQAEIDTSALTFPTLVPKMILDNNYDILCKLNDSLYIASGYFQKRFTLLDAQERPIKQFEEFPAYWPNEKSVPVEIKSMYHQSKFSKHPAMNMLAVVTTDVLSIYRITNDSLSPICEQLLHPYEYEYTLTEKIMAVNKKDFVPRGVIDIASDLRYIYLLLNPNSQASSAYQPNEVWCFDWEGNHRFTMAPDVDLCVISTKNDGKIFGLNQHAESILREISLSDSEK